METRSREDRVNNDSLQFTAMRLGPMFERERDICAERGFSLGEHILAFCYLDYGVILIPALNEAFYTRWKTLLMLSDLGLLE